MTMKVLLPIALIAGLIAEVSGAGEDPSRLTLHLIDGNRLALECRAVSLREILHQFTRHAVTVRIDPRVDATLTLSLPAQPLDRALPRLLSGWDYVLTWDRIPGPVRNLTRLAEIQVFPKGDPSRLETLSPVPPQTATVRQRQRITRFVQGEVLLRLKPGLSDEAFRELLRRIGGTVIDSYAARGIYRIVVPDETDILKLVADLRRDALIDRAEPHYVYPLPPRGFIPQPDSVRAATLKRPDGETTSSPLAILDSGLAPRDELQGLVWAALDSTDPQRPLADSQGHGTQMALIGGGLIQPTGITGESAAVSLIPIRAFDDQGYASSLTLIRSVDYAVANGARVINMSWGSEDSSDFLAEAIAQGLDAQILMVAAVGNEPTGQPVYPAALPGVIGIAATGPDGGFWPESNSGEFVDLAAPGQAALPVGYGGPPGEYAGTSIASVFVARTLALYLSQNPQATPESAWTRLQSSLSPLPAGASTNRWGAGILDQAAVDRFLAAP